MVTPPDTIDADQCAELLKCTKDQVEDLARHGEIPGLKLGRGWLFIRADLLAFLAAKARAEATDRRSKREKPPVAVYTPPTLVPPTSGRSGRRNAIPNIPPLAAEQ